MRLQTLPILVLERETRLAWSVFICLVTSFIKSTSLREAVAESPARIQHSANSQPLVQHRIQPSYQTDSAGEIVDLAPVRARAKFKQRLFDVLQYFHPAVSGIDHRDFDHTGIAPVHH